MADVFISYAREDKAFVRRLHDALASRTLDAWVDWEDIPPTADFMREICAAIEAADTVVLVVSPEWCASTICLQEVNHALAHNKRLVPLVCREVEPSRIVPGVAALNWIFFRETDDFGAAFESLVSAINTDLERTRALTRLLVRAIEWDTKARDTSFLLRGIDLAEAEQQVAGARADATPQPTALQRDYVLASRVDSVRRQRRTLALLATGLAIALVLAAVAFWQYRVAEQRRQAEQAARLDAERKTRIAEAQRLAAEANGALERFPQRALLLASEAVAVARVHNEPVVADAEQALRRALGAVGGRGFGGDGMEVSAVALSPDGRWLAMGGDNTASLWELSANRPPSPTPLSDAKGMVTGVAFGRDSRWLVTVSREGGARMWDLASGTPLPARLPLPKGVARVDAAVISDDHRQLIAGGADGPMVVWDLANANAADHPRAYEAGALPDFEFFTLGGARLTTSADGRWMASKGIGGPARLWRLDATTTNTRPLVLDGSDGLLPAVSISPDSRWVVAAGDDAVIRVWDLTMPDPVASRRDLPGHLGDLTATAFSSDGRWLVTGNEDKTARVWDLRADHPERSVRVLGGHGDMVRALSISNDGRWIVTSSLVNRLDPGGHPDTSARLWDLQRADSSAGSFELAGHESGVSAALVTADGRWAITGSDAGQGRLWDLSAADPSAKPLVLRGHERGIFETSVSANGHWLVTRSVDMSVRVWDLRSPQSSGSPLLLGLAGSALEFSPNSRWLVARGSPEDGRLWDVASENPGATAVVLPKLQTYDSPAPVSFSADSRWLGTGGEFVAARLVNLTAGRVEGASQEIDKGGGKVRALAISPDGHWLVSNREYTNREVRLWRITDEGAAVQPLVLKGHKDSISHVVISADSQWLATGSDDSTVRLWNLTKTDPSVAPNVLSGHTKRISACRFSPDGRWLITASDEGTVQLWGIEAGQLTTPTRLPGHTAYVFGLSFSPDGRWLVTAGGDGGARLWDLQGAMPDSTGRVFPAHEGDVRSVTYSSDGRWMVSLDENHTARLWNLRSADPTAQPLVLGGHETGVGLVAISPDGRWLATAGAPAATSLKDRAVRLWDLGSVDPSTSPLVLLGHERGVSSLTVSRDSRWLVTGSEDATMRLWNLAAENPSAAPTLLTGHNAPIRQAVVSPDSRLLASADQNGIVRLWHLKQDDLISLARLAAGRNLSVAEWALSFQGQPYRKTFAELPGPRSEPAP